MKYVIEAVEKLRSHPGVFIDVNFGQGKEVFHKQLARRMERESLTVEEVESQIRMLKKDIAELITKVEPYQLPDDYLFFLEYYGGLAVSIYDEYRFEIQGIGPMVNEEYGDFVCDNWGERSDPLLPGPRGLIIGYLRLDLRLERAKVLGVRTETVTSFDKTKLEHVPSKWIEFRIDLAGKVKKHSIIALGPDETDSVHPLSIGDGDNRRWQKLADSFSEWLVLASETYGLFRYEYLEAS